MLRPCYKCGGTGLFGALACSLCEGEGSAPTPAEVQLRERVSRLEIDLVALQVAAWSEKRNIRIGAALLALCALAYYLN